MAAPAMSIGGEYLALPTMHKMAEIMPRAEHIIARISTAIQFRINPTLINTNSVAANPNTAHFT